MEPKRRDSPAAPTPRPAPGRRRASQARSKATVQRILDSAAALIVEKGAKPVTMTEIAQRAQVVIGSLYQYFADKSAIHAALLMRHNADVRLMLHSHLSKVDTFEGFLDAMEVALNQYFDLHQKDPLFNSIWSIVQTDAALQIMDIEDTLQNARFVHGVVQPMLPGIDSDRLMATCALLVQFSLYTGRFARAVPPAIGRQTLPVFQRMMRDAFEGLEAESDAAEA